MMYHRLIAPEGLAPTTIELADGFQLAVPADGIVEIPHALEMPGDTGVFEPVDRVVETHWLRQLLNLGFRQLPRSGSSADRPAAGRYPARCFSTKLSAGRYGGRGVLGATRTAPRFRTMRQRT
jgi:hypothetical protein